MNPLDLNLVCKLPPGVVIVPFMREHLNNFVLNQPDLQGHDESELRHRITTQAEGGQAITVIQRGNAWHLWLITHLDRLRRRLVLSG